MGFIEIEQLSKSFKGQKVRALDQVSLTVSEGECFGLIGPNGAGKTTLMSCLVALIRPDSGKIRVGGVPPDDFAVRSISGFMPERPNFENWVSGKEFLTYHSMLAGRPRERIKKEVEAALEMVGLEQSSWRRRTNTYSRGMLQRLGLAQAIIGSPRILFLDEPGSGMDPPGNALLRNLFAEFKSKGITVVLNSHHLDEMERVCDRVAFIKAGKIISIEKIAQLENREHTVLVKWTTNGHDAITGDALKTLLAGSAVSLRESSGDWARFNVPTNEDAVQLIKTLVQAGVPVMSATPEHASLSQLFENIHAAQESGASS